MKFMVIMIIIIVLLGAYIILPDIFHRMRNADVVLPNGQRVKVHQVMENGAYRSIAEKNAPPSQKKLFAFYDRMMEFFMGKR